MRIALITRTYALDGGVAVHVRHSAAALRRAGHDVMVLAGDDVPVRDGFSVPGIGQSDLSPAAVRSLALRLKGKAEICHFHHVDDPGLVAGLTEDFATVVSAHGWSACPSGSRLFGDGTECFRSRGPVCIPNMLFRNCNHQRNPSSPFRNYAQSQNRLDAMHAADRIAVYSRAVEGHLRSNGFSAIDYVPLLIERAKAEPMDAHVPRVLFVGRLAALKGVDVLLKSMDWFDAAVHICGDGPHRQTLERLVRVRGLEARVFFHGWCDSPRLEQHYADASLVAVPSRYPEPFGMVGAEALARGRAVVATKAGGTGDWLRDGVSGRLVASSDSAALGSAIAAMIDDPELLQEFGTRGQREVRSLFSEESHLRELIRTYVSALEAREERMTCRAVA